MAIFKTTYRITWSDTDAAQVVHHSNYFRLFERAEEELYEHLGLSLSQIFEGFWLPRVEVFCRYKSPCRFGDVLEIETAVQEVREKTVKYTYNVKKSGTGALVAEGYVVAAAADKKLEKAINIPAEIAEKLKDFKKS